MQEVLVLDRVTKVFGQSRGVSNLTFSLSEGKVYGFLGPNGAGKTTTINMLVNLTSPSQGNIKIFGLDTQIHGNEIRQNIGYLSSDMVLDGGLTGKQQIEYFGHMHSNFDKRYVQSLVKRFDCPMDRKIKNLSRGNRQKVALITALMHRPMLLLLDEPTSGFDPLMQVEFNKIVLEYKAEGKTVFISSHMLSEVQELCDEVIFIREGKVLSQANVANLLIDAPRQVAIVTSDKVLLSKLKKLEGVTQLKIEATRISLTYTGATQVLITLLSKYQIDDLLIEETDLENMFVGYYKNEAHNV